MPDEFKHGEHEKTIGSVVRAPNGRLYLVTAAGARELSREQSRVVDQLVDGLVRAVTKEVVQKEHGQGTREADPTTSGGLQTMSETIVLTGRCVNIYVGPVVVGSPPPPLAS